MVHRNSSRRSTLSYSFRIGRDKHCSLRQPKQLKPGLHSPMTGEEQELLGKYMNHLNILGEEGTHPSIDAWYQEVRYALGPNAPNP